MSDRPLKRFLNSRKGRKVLADIESAIEYVIRQYGIDDSRMIWVMIREVSEKKLDE